MAQGDITLTFAGTVTAEPELRFVPAGHAVASFTVATNPRTYDRDAGQWRDGDPTFLRVNVWRQQAENVAETVTKGTRVTVAGVLRQRSYETKEGGKRTTYEVTADEVSVSLRWATAKIVKAGRRESPAGGGGDPWESAGQGEGPPF